MKRFSELSVIITFLGEVLCGHPLEGICSSHRMEAVFCRGHTFRGWGARILGHYHDLHLYHPLLSSVPCKSSNRQLSGLPKLIHVLSCTSLDFVKDYLTFIKIIKGKINITYPPFPPPLDFPVDIYKMN